MAIKFWLMTSSFILMMDFCGHASGQTKRQIWEVDLAKIPGIGTVARDELPVLALRFSPDGNRIAAVVGRYADTQSLAFTSHLFVLDVSSPAGKAQRFEIPAGVSDSENGPGLFDFGWSPLGDMINVGGSVIRLQDGRVCQVPSQGGFITKDRVVTHTGRTRTDSGHTSVWNATDFSHGDCPLARVLEGGNDWGIHDISADRHLLFVSIVDPTKASSDESLLVDALDGRVIHRLQGVGYQFADSGKAICGGGTVDEDARVPVTCWDSDTGVEIATASSVNGGTPIATALHASRIIASDYSRVPIPFTTEYAEVLRRRVVWDFHSGRELISWRPQYQTYLFRTRTRSRSVKEPFRFAISPGGTYILEGGNGILSLYRIEP